MLTFDRTNAGQSSFSSSFACKHAVKMSHDHNKIKLHIFVDTSSVEIFGNEGEVVVTNLIFPASEEKKRLELYVDGNATLHSMEVYQLTSTL